MAVDQLKKLHRRVVQKRHPTGLVFHHVPKCGGTSVGRAIRRHYFLSQATIDARASFRAVEATLNTTDPLAVLDAARGFRERALLYHLHCGVRCVSAHVRFSALAYQAFNAEYGFVTVLRDPVERYLSHYFMSADRDGHLPVDETLEAFAASPLGKAYGAVYADYFAGLAPGERFDTEEAIARAVDNLGRFSTVGFLDDLERFRADIGRAFGFRPSIGHENRATNARSSAARAVSAAVLEQVKEVCAPDIAVYTRIRALLNDRD